MKESELTATICHDDASGAAGDGNETLTEVLHKAGRHMEDTIGGYDCVKSEKVELWHLFLKFYGRYHRINIELVLWSI